MTVWTKDEFQKDSHKYWSKRDGTIAEIDTALDQFHGASDLTTMQKKLEDLYDVIGKFEAEKKLKHQAAPEKQSKKRMNSVAKLRIQVEAERWQLEYLSKYQDRSDLKDYFKDGREDDRDDKVLADWLERLKIQVKQGDAATNKLKRDLHAAIEGFFHSDAPKPWLPAVKQIGFPWVAANLGQDSYIGDPDKYRLADPLRFASIDLESIVNGQPEYVMMGAKGNPDWATKDEKKAIFYKVLMDRESLVSAKQSEFQVSEFLPSDIRKLTEDYLHSLLTVDLAEQVQLVKRALASEDGFRAVVHIDYYATRSTTQVGLHKDTTGNNLFAVLHYINDAPMLGPEYIDDPAPIESMVEGYYFDQYWFTTENNYKRQGAPWAKVGKKKWTWPCSLLEGLQIARESTKSDVARGKMASSILPKDGLVTFVDELIFHATPIEGHRTKDSGIELVRSLSAGVSVTSLHKDGKASFDILNLFGTKNHADRIKRRMSAHYDQGTHIETGLTIPGSTTGGVRKFFRLWICIVPKHWYSTLPAYP